MALDGRIGNERTTRGSENGIGWSRQAAAGARSFDAIRQLKGWAMMKASAVRAAGAGPTVFLNRC